MKEFRQLIDKWPSIAEFARDIGIDYSAAKEMARGSRRTIPARYWYDMVNAAEKRDLDGVTYERLAVFTKRAFEGFEAD